MKYNITINQPLMIEYGLNFQSWCILDVIATAPTWCEPVIFGNEVYYWIARQKISEELSALELKPDTIYRYIKELSENNFIEHVKDGKKDLMRLSKKGKELFTAMSEKNPNYYVGKKSENNSEKNPTYNYTTPDNHTKINTRDALIAQFKKEVPNFSELTIQTAEWFIDYRKKIKKPIKTVAPIKLFIDNVRECINAGHKLNDLIEMIEAHEWQTIKIEWVENKSRQTNGNGPKKHGKDISVTMSAYEQLCAERASKNDFIDGEVLK